MEAPGPRRADDIRHKEPVELSEGRVIHLMPTGNRGAELQMAVGAAIAADPDVERAGVDVGFSPTPGTLRAPDVAVIPGAAAAGWVKGVPPFAIEYADVGQDEGMLRSKIDDLLRHGTQVIWVVRLSGLPRVEIYTGEGRRIATLDETLEVPGVLRNPVPVRALFDAEVARAHQFNNLLQRYGFRSVEELQHESFEEGRQEGREEGREEGELSALRLVLRMQCTARGWSLGPEAEAGLAAAPRPRLAALLLRVLSAPSLEALLAEG